MRILVDENVPRLVVEWLRRDGHDVAWVAEETPGEDDPPILDRSVRESRVLVTHDLDFGGLIYRDGKHAVGVVQVRLETEPPEEYLASFATFWRTVEPRAIGSFAVISDRRVRISPLPR